MTMTEKGRIRIGIQKSGRLTEKSLKLLEDCGLNLELRKDRLVAECINFPLDLMLLRDDDIPDYVIKGLCDIGIVGENVLKEKLLARETPIDLPIMKRLGYGECRLSMAFPNERPYIGLMSLKGLRIATSYPAILKKYLKDNDLQAEVVEMKGSVEIAPTLLIADAICDLVSTGMTLKSHGLKEVCSILRSEAVLVRAPGRFPSDKEIALQRLLKRIDGVKKAECTKYVMMNAPKSALESIQSILPGMERPSIMNLSNDESRIAIHAVCRERVFWETMERLKEIGASSILVLPIEKIIE